MHVVLQEELFQQLLCLESERVLLFLVEKEFPFFAEIRRNTQFFPVYFQLPLEQMKLFCEKKFVVLLGDHTEVVVQGYAHICDLRLEHCAADRSQEVSLDSLAFDSAEEILADVLLLAHQLATLTQMFLRRYTLLTPRISKCSSFSNVSKRYLPWISSCDIST